MSNPTKPSNGTRKHRKPLTLSLKENEFGSGMSHFRFVLDDSATPSPSPIPAVSNLSAHWEQLRNAFIGMYLPDAIFTGHRRVDGVTGNWLTEIQGESIASKALETAVAACASVQIGQDRGDKQLISQGREIYQVSLQHMRTALASSELRSTDATLAACMALSLYELFANRTGEDCMYESHAKGAMALLQMRGPDSIQSPLAHSIFLGLRRQLVSCFLISVRMSLTEMLTLAQILNCLVNHAEMFISQGAWKEKPWGKYKKNSVDRCLDALYMIPPIQNILDDARCQSDPDEMRRMCLHVIERCLEIDTYLQKWYEEVERSHTGPMYWPVFSSASGDHGKSSIFPTVFEFSSFSICYQLTTYWSGLYVTYDILRMTYQILASLDPIQSAEFNLAAKQKEEDWIRLSRNVCQSHEFFMRRENGRAGLLVDLAMLRGCHYNFTTNTQLLGAEAAWVETQIMEISQRLNSPLLR